jgi:hypothetical protein
LVSGVSRPSREKRYWAKPLTREKKKARVRRNYWRHARATDQWHQYGVPLTALAEAMGHALTASGDAPEATRYYTQMPENQKAEIRHDTVMAMMDDARLAVRVIDPEEEAQRLERMMLEADDRTREVPNAMVAFTRSPSGTAAFQDYASAGLPGRSASGARSWCADRNSSTALTSCSRAI